MKSFKKSFWLILLAGLGGCDSPAERLIKEQVQLVNAAADRVESGNWDAIYGQEISARTLDNIHKQEKLKISAEDRQRLEDKYRPEMEKARARLSNAWQKMTGKPQSGVPGMPAGMSSQAEPDTSKPAENDKAPAAGPKREDGKPDDDKKPPSH